MEADIKQQKRYVMKFTVSSMSAGVFLNVAKENRNLEVIFIPGENGNDSTGQIHFTHYRDLVFFGYMCGLKRIVVAFG